MKIYLSRWQIYFLDEEIEENVENTFKVIVRVIYIYVKKREGGR